MNFYEYISNYCLQNVAKISDITPEFIEDAVKEFECETYVEVEIHSLNSN